MASIEPVAGSVEGVIVAKVLAAGRHPDADRLSVCSVDTGTGEPVTVVCGAPNARAGLRAPYVPVGGRVAGGKKIRASKIRGVESFGMLCSPVELGLGEDADGLLELDDGADGPHATAAQGFHQPSRRGGMGLNVADYAPDILGTFILGHQRDRELVRDLGRNRRHLTRLHVTAIDYPDFPRTSSSMT